MANVGTFATDAEYSVMVPGFPQPGEYGQTGSIDRPSILIRCVEAAIRREVNLPDAAETVTGDEYSIEWPQVQDGVIINRQTSFMLRRSPISEFTGLRIVGSRDPITGAVLTSTTIPRNSYHVELDTGIVRELTWSLMQGYPFPIWPGGGFPSGTMILQADYKTATGQATDDLSQQVKLVCFMAVARLFKQFENNRWDIASMSMDGQSITYIDVQFTKQELGHLSGMKRPVFPSFY
jgi:hypothetical protein